MASEIKSYRYPVQDFHAFVVKLAEFDCQECRPIYQEMASKSFEELDRSFKTVAKKLFRRLSVKDEKCTNKSHKENLFCYDIYKRTVLDINPLVVPLYFTHDRESLYAYQLRMANVMITFLLQREGHVVNPASRVALGPDMRYRIVPQSVLYPKFLECEMLRSHFTLEIYNEMDAKFKQGMENTGQAALGLTAAAYACYASGVGFPAGIFLSLTGAAATPATISTVKSVLVGRSDSTRLTYTPITNLVSYAFDTASSSLLGTLTLRKSNQWGVIKISTSAHEDYFVEFDYNQIDPLSQEVLWNLGEWLRKKLFEGALKVEEVLAILQTLSTFEPPQKKPFLTKENSIYFILVLLIYISKKFTALPSDVNLIKDINRVHSYVIPQFIKYHHLEPPPTF